MGASAWRANTRSRDPEPRTFQARGRSIPFTLERKKRKTLSVKVRAGPRVEVSVPLRCTEAQVLEFLEDRADWILRKLDFIAQHQPPTPDPEYLPGEIYPLLGRHYTLKVVQEIRTQVRLEGEALVVASHAPGDPAATRALLDRWYKNQARTTFADRLEHCLGRFAEPEAFRPAATIVRPLRARWGSMSSGRRMTLNQHLVRGPLEVIDLVITHELCHIAHPNHGKGFYALLAQVMPDWKQRNERLKQLIL